MRVQDYGIQNMLWSKNNINININNLDLIIKPKKNKQYMIEDTTERSKIIKKILEYKKS